MWVESLRLQNFRNYRSCELRFPSGVVVFYGDNGQGKSNLLEAIHLLISGDSFRPYQVSSLLLSENGQTAPAARISAKAHVNSQVHDLDAQYGPEKSEYFRNGKRTTAKALVRQFPLVMFSPESLMAIKEGPELRRKLIDEMLLTHSPIHAKVLYDFKKALRMRNKILRDAKEGVQSKSQAVQLLDSLEPSYLPLAVELTMARQQAIRDMANDLSSALASILEASEVDISVDYLISGQSGLHWSRADLLSAMHQRAQELREAELSSGLSLVGPHRHDIRFLFAGKDSRFFCSQGQQRALILSFKMAQILYHYRAYQIYPLLLLDDVLSELDPVRRSSLVKLLKDIPSQIFLTTTDLSFSGDFGDRRLNVFFVEKGMVHPQ